MHVFGNMQTNSIFKLVDIFAFPIKNVRPLFIYLLSVFWFQREGFGFKTNFFIGMITSKIVYIIILVYKSKMVFIEIKPKAEQKIKPD